MSGPAEQVLEVSGHLEAQVIVPVPGRSVRPALIVLHGNFDRPEWQCDVWRRIVKGRYFVLCPRGIRRADVASKLDRYTYGSAAAVKAELIAVLNAAKARYRGYIDVHEPVLVGFSLGAVHVARLLTEGPFDVSRAVLVEGGYKHWSRTTLSRFAARGGRRLLIGCGQSACRHAARKLERLASYERIELRVADGGDAGHTYTGPVASALAAELDWLVAQDPRFAAAAGG